MAFLSTKSLSSSFPCKSISRLFAIRFHSSLPNSGDPFLRKVEDAVHRILVRRAAPDWLPFLPGASYWVPPPRSVFGNGISQLIEKLANPLTDEQTLATTTVRGWPSSDYFLKGENLIPLDTKASSVKVRPKALLNESEAVTTSSNASKTEDDQG